MKQYVYPSLKARIKTEYMIYLLALVFILIADSIGQIEIPMGPGKFILFPIFYALILGIISGPQVTKIVAYVSIIGLLTACPISPCREFVIEAANKINFTAPLTMVGAYAGISISGQIKSFLKQGWKMIVIGVFVMTGTFICSALIAQIVLSITGAI